MLKNKKVRRSKRQSAWEFMRRNRYFRVGDVMMITQMGKQNMRVFIGQLTKEKILRGESKISLPFTEKFFRLIDDRGVACPVASPSKYIKRRDI